MLFTHLPNVALALDSPLICESTTCLNMASYNYIFTNQVALSYKTNFIIT